MSNEEKREPAQSNEEKREPAPPRRKARDECPYDPVTQNREWTMWRLKRGRQVKVRVNRDPRGKVVPVRLAGINGCEWWSESDRNETVPEEVARIAVAAGVAMAIEELEDRGRLVETGTPAPPIADHPDASKRDQTKAPVG